jgi:hypothetical protein
MNIVGKNRVKTPMRQSITGDDSSPLSPVSRRTFQLA